jgi:hypothetical protein
MGFLQTGGSRFISSNFMSAQSHPLNNETGLIIPQELSVSAAKLPQVYESAKLALAECYRIDECADWANKAEALASYARQAEDDELLKTATRVKARAIRRCGELLKAIEAGKGGRPMKTTDAAVSSFTRTQAAREAGLSERQQVTAVRVASVPSERFEAAIESETPPTVTKLAEIGTKPQPKPLVDLNGRKPEDFSLSTQGQGAIERMAKTVAEIDPAAIVRGASVSERLVIKQRIANIAAWLEQLQQELEDYEN